MRKIVRGALLCWFALAVATWIPAAGARSAPAAPSSAVLAATPPMGWNSWDAYATTIREPQVRATARYIARHLKRYGWRYVVIDEGWYEGAPASGQTGPSVTLDRFGRYIPNPRRYPSSANGAGMKPLADYIHSLGLKFGIHILRGVPKQAVAANSPIAGSSFRARDAADESSPCPWNGLNWGAKPGSAAGQAYYDSIARLYASWGVDFLKVDCISSHPYRGEEIRMMSAALRAAGRPIVLSLSPGPAPLAHAATLVANSQMWRMADDLWDLWEGRGDAFPQGVENQFARAAAWEPYAGPGHWPNADMLPIGQLRPQAGWGPPRASRLSATEQRTMITAWCVFRSPLIIGGNVLLDDPQTTALLTNPEVLAVDQASTGNHPVSTGTPNAAVWVARATSARLRGDWYVAVFNLGEQARDFSYSNATLGLPPGVYRARDLWLRKSLGRETASAVNVSLPPHASALFRLDPAKR